MKIKKPSVKGMKNTGYLGHFAKDKYMAEGHNTNAVMRMKEKYGMQYSSEEERQRAFDQLEAMVGPKASEKRPGDKTSEQLRKESEIKSRNDAYRAALKKQNQTPEGKRRIAEIEAADRASESRREEELIRRIRQRAEMKKKMGGGF